MALRTTASAIWSRFVPAARQALPASSSSFFRQGRFFSTGNEGEDDEDDVEYEDDDDEDDDDDEEWEYDEHAPPLNLFGLPARYASALYSASSRAGVLPVVQGEFKAVIDAADANPSFKTFLEDPTMSKHKKIAGLTDFCDGANMQEITKNFLCVVAENGRLSESKKIYECLDEYVMANNGEVKATVTSAHPMNPDQLSKLTAQLSTFVDEAGAVFLHYSLFTRAMGPCDEGESLKIETKVDPRIVGGFTVAMGEDYYDLSLMSRIRHVEQELQKPLDISK